jgi:hypothetical protein
MERLLIIPVIRIRLFARKPIVFPLIAVCLEIDANGAL